MKQIFTIITLIGCILSLSINDIQAKHNSKKRTKKPLATVVDQKNDKGAYIASYTILTTSTVGQSYTAGISGGLTKIELLIRCSGCASITPPDIKVSIYATDASGFPTGSSLGTATITSFNDSDSLYRTAVLSTPINQVNGTKYAILPSIPSAMTSPAVYQLIANKTNVYTAGSRLAFSSVWASSSVSDFKFKTYVDSALPVSLLYFRGKASQSTEGYVNTLNWATASEVNAQSFTLERSRDLQTFTPITTIAAAGNSTEQQEYTYTDSHPDFGTNYYRLSQTDFDGSIHHYQTIAVISEDKNTPFGVFPNPINSKKFNVKVENGNEAQLNLFNEQGIKIAIETIKISETIVEVRPRTELQKGTYFLQVQGLTTIKTYKVMMNGE